MFFSFLYFAGYLKHPLPSDITLQLTFTRASDEQILNGPEVDGVDYSIQLTSFELFIKRLVLNPVLYNKIEERLNSSALNYYYYRFQVFSYLMQGSSISYESPELFASYHLPPMVCFH